jgi:hypothetical protein
MCCVLEADRAEQILVAKGAYHGAAPWCARPWRHAADHASLGTHFNDRPARGEPPRSKR